MPPKFIFYLKKLRLSTSPNGQLLIELALTIGLAALLIPTLMLSLMASRDGKVRQIQQAQAVSLLKETEEAVRAMQKKGWSSIPASSSNPYHPEISGSLWTLLTGASTSARLTQEVFISDVNRDDNGNIVASPSGTRDPSTKKVEVKVSWTQPNTNSIGSTFYITHTLNYTQAHTSVADFNAGTKVQTIAVTGTPGEGEIRLGNNNKAKWCTPEFSSAKIDLPDGPPVALAATASAVATLPNDVFAATAPYTTSSAKLAYVKVTANTDPPVPSLQGVFTLDPTKYTANFPSGIGLDNNFKTNGVKYYKSSTGKTYALMTTNLADKEVIAVLVNDNDPSNDNTNNGEFQDYQANPKIYKYWTFFNTQIYANAPPIVQNFDTGFRDPSANTPQSNPNNGDGNGYQTTPTNAYSDDANNALDTSSGTNTDTNCDSISKDRHRYYNYNITTASGATINGVEVRLDARIDSTSSTSTRKMCVELSWDGGTTWTAAKSTGNLTTSMATYTLGGSADTWGRTWNDTNFTNANFLVRITNVANNTSREFRLDWAAVKVYYSTSTPSNDQAAFGHGATALSVLGNTGYVASGGYLYVFDLSNIDSKSSSTGLDMKGCRILLDGFECQPAYGTDLKYSEGETGTTWSSTAGPAHPDTCYDGGNIELYSNNDIFPVKVGTNTYIYTAIGAGTNPEFEIADVSTVPSASRSDDSTCGRGTDTGWKVTDTIDFNDDSGTEEAANSVFAKSDGSRAYISSNGGDAKQFFIINTATKTDIRFLSGTTSPPTSGFYYGTSPRDELYVRRSLTVLNGDRAVLVGKDGNPPAGVPNGDDAQEYQVLNIENEATVVNNNAYCSGLNFDEGINDLTSVSEADHDNFVYLVTNTSANELRIIQGGPDSAVFIQSGQFESNTIDATQSSVFNRFLAHIDKPSDSRLEMQVAAEPKSGGVCPSLSSSYYFLGPDKTPSTFFTPTAASVSAQVPFGTYGSSPSYENPATCFRYKAWLYSSTDQLQTPKIYDAILNYSQ